MALELWSFQELLLLAELFNHDYNYNCLVSQSLLRESTMQCNENRLSIQGKRLILTIELKQQKGLN